MQFQIAFIAAVANLISAGGFFETVSNKIWGAITYVPQKIGDRFIFRIRRKHLYDDEYLVRLREEANALTKAHREKYPFKAVKD